MTDRRNEMPDEMMERALHGLRALPPVDRRAVARIVDAAVVARREAIDGEGDDTVPAFLPVPRPLFPPLPIGIGIAAAAGIAGFVLHSAVTRPEVRSPAMATTTSSQMTPAANTAADLRPVATPFVLSRPAARAVSIIGDFNNWGATPVPLTRDANGNWSVVLALVPGRHTYSFVVDDSVVLDPLNPSAVDPDFKVKRSVIIVGKP